MNIFIDNKSGKPIYEQIYSQIKAQIISGAGLRRTMGCLRSETLPRI